MKHLTCLTIAVFGLSGLGACAEAEPDAEEAVACAIENDDGTCACEVVDEAGQCVEGGGAVIIRSNN